MAGSDKRGKAPRLPTQLGPDARGHGGDSSDWELIYGRNPLREALRGRRRVRQVWLAAGRAGDDVGGLLPRWAAEGDAALPQLTRLDVDALSELARTDDHQGVVAEVDPFPYVEPDELLAGADLIVALDRVQDPHNLGAIIRTAEVAGAGVVIPRHRAAHITATVVKAAAGATEHARIAQVRNLTDFLGSAKSAGFWVYGAAGEGMAAYDEQDYRGKSIVVLGSEGEGLGQRVTQACDVLVRIAVRGKVDSLNVSVAAGVLLFEALRQRTAARGGESS
jgi:23S rRNA (guanosine2251-2'-O)-methyltransferase